MANLRQQNYLNQIESKSISLFFSGNAPKKSNDQSYPFTVNRNFFYLTGIVQQNAILCLIKGQELSKSYLFIQQVDEAKALWDGATLSFEKALEISGVDEVKDILTLDTFIASILSANRTAIFGGLNKVYLDFESKPIDALQDLVTAYGQKVQQSYPFLKIENSHLTLAQLRMIKDEAEVKDISTALKTTTKAFHHLFKSVSGLAYEHELEAEYNYILNKHQVVPSFNTIVASGVNATTLHYVDNNAPLVEDGLVLVDAGVEFNNYCSDITRTFPKSGKFTARQKDLYELVLKANEETIKWVKPGYTMKEFNDFGKKILSEGAKKLGLIKEDDELIKYYYHSLGHGLGLDVHDVSDYSMPIKEGMVLTVEPGLYIKEEAIGIRIEDDILITKDGCINLSKDIIKSVKDLENYMNS